MLFVATIIHRIKLSSTRLVAVSSQILNVYFTYTFAGKILLSWGTIFGKSYMCASYYTRLWGYEDECNINLSIRVCILVERADLYIPDTWCCLIHDMMLCPFVIYMCITLCDWESLEIREHTNLLFSKCLWNPFYVQWLCKGKYTLCCYWQNS